MGGGGGGGGGGGASRRTDARIHFNPTVTNELMVLLPRQDLGNACWEVLLCRISCNNA